MDTPDARVVDVMDIWRASGVYKLKISVGQQYPMLPPSMHFATKVFHPNVHIDVSRATSLSMYK